MLFSLAMAALVAVLAVVIVAWFAGGTIFNVRRGRSVMRWMQDGLPALGGRTTVRWLGSTAVEMVIREARAPFTGLTLVIFLEPRDLPWMWALGRASGRRDTLIVRGVLARAASIELEALDPASWSGRDALRRVPSEWQTHENERSVRGGIVVHHADAREPPLARELLAAGQRAGMIVRRLSLRRSEPHFQLHVALPDERRPGHDFFEAVRAIAERALA